MAELIKTKLYLPSGEFITTDLLETTKLKTNFTVGEVANKEAKDEVKLVIGDPRAWKLLDMMQLTRDCFGSITVSSGYRTKAYNRKIGGDTNSAHLYFWAWDWWIQGETAAKRKEKYLWWRNLCREFNEIGAINYYTDGYHCEIGSDILFGATMFVQRNYIGKKGDW